MNLPNISVVMSVFNGRGFLSVAIESILNQTLRDFEFVIINDGSTDGAADILSQYERSDNRVRVLHQDNKGRALSLNDGINHAKGSLIVRMDADDIALPDRLEKQLAFMEQHADVGLLGGALDLIGPEGAKLVSIRPPTDDFSIRSAMISKNAIHHPTVIMRKELVLAVGGYRKPLLDSDDYDLFLRLGERSRLANLRETVLWKRVHRNQASVRNLTHQALCTLAARTAARLRKRGAPDPIGGVREITPELLHQMGVGAEEIRQTLIGVYAYWIDLLRSADAQSALPLIDRQLELCQSDKANRVAASNALMSAAEIYWRQRKRAKALQSVRRAILLRPIVAGRPVKRLFARIAKGLNG